jgi:hypothetical protein
MLKQIWKPIGVLVLGTALVLIGNALGLNHTQCAVTMNGIIIDAWDCE